MSSYCACVGADCSSFRFIWVSACVVEICVYFFFFQAEDGIRDLVRSRGLGDVYKRQGDRAGMAAVGDQHDAHAGLAGAENGPDFIVDQCLSLIHI